jgi:hypothetical protein
MPAGQERPFMFSASRTRDIPLPAGEADPKSRLRAALQQLGYRRARGKTQDASAGMPGSLNHLNPNRLKHSLKWTHSPEDASLHLEARSACLPWTRRRVERLLEGHLERVEQRLSGQGAQEEKGAARILVVPPVGEAGFFPSLGSVFLSLLLGTLFACLVHLAFGYGLIRDTLDSLIAKSDLLARFSPLPFPEHDDLQALPDTFRWACALFFAIPLGMMTGLAGSLLLLVGEVWQRMCRSAIPLLFLTCVALCAYAYPPEPGLWNVLCTLTLPCAILAGYTLGWGIRGATPCRSFLSARRSTFFLLALLLLIQGWVDLNRALPAFAGGRAANFLEFRDRHLLRSRVGAWLTDFYYTYTLYPAEAIKPPLRRTEKAALICTKDGTLRARISTLLEDKGVRPISVDEDQDPARLVAKGGFDFLLLDPESAGTLEVLRNTGECDGWGAIHDAAVLVGAPEDIEALYRGEGSSFPPERLSTPLNPEKLGAALASVSERLDRTGNLRRVTRLSLYSTLAGLWLLSALTKMLLVLLPSLIGLHLGLRSLRTSRPFYRIVVLVPAVLASGILSWVLYVHGPETREIAEIRSLGADTNSAELLCSYLGHPNPDVRYEAAYGLWRFEQQGRATRACGPAKVHGIEDPDPRVRAWSALLLGREESRAARDALIQALEDPALFVRTKAAAALGRTGDAYALEALERRLDDEDAWYVRQHLLSARRTLMNRLPTVP